MSPRDYPLELAVRDVHALLAASPGHTVLLDVREPFELELCAVAGATHVPLRRIPESVETLPRDKHIFVLCHSGGRSRRVTEFLRSRGFEAVTNIAGGIDAWAVEIDPTLRRY